MIRKKTIPITLALSLLISIFSFSEANAFKGQDQGYIFLCSHQFTCDIYGMHKKPLKEENMNQTNCTIDKYSKSCIQTNCTIDKYSKNCNTNQLQQIQPEQSLTTKTFCHAISKGSWVQVCFKLRV